MVNVFRDPAGKPEERYKMIYPTWMGASSEKCDEFGLIQ